MTWNKMELITFLQNQTEEQIFQIKKIREKNIRSTGQLKYYRKVVVWIIGDYHWLSPIETNESIKLIFKQESFTDLDTSEFKFVIETIIDLRKTKYWVNIPTPKNAEDDSSLYKSLWF